MSVTSTKVDFCVHPFYYFTGNGKMFRTKDRVRISLDRNKLRKIINTIESLFKLYDTSTYDDMLSLSNIKKELEADMLIFWCDFIEPVIDDDGIKNNSPMSAFINIVAGNIDSLEKTLKSVIICMLLAKNFGCKHTVSYTACVGEKINDETLQDTIAKYWNILDDLLFFRPMYSVDQNLFILLLQLFLLNHVTAFCDDHPTDARIQLQDAASNRLGCFIQYWLRQGNDTEVANVYNQILANQLFKDVASKLRQYIIKNKDMYNICIKKSSFKLLATQMHCVILDPKKGFLKYTHDFIMFVDTAIKDVLLIKQKQMAGTALTDLNFGASALYLLYDGFCMPEPSINTRHLQLLKTQCMMQLRGIMLTESILDKCIDLILSENFVTAETLKEWSRQKCIILLREAYGTRQKYDKIQKNGRVVIFKK